MGTTLVYVFYSIVLLLFVVSEPTYRDEEKDGDREYNRIIEHLRSNINNQ